jgi:hypothetical protein
VAEDDGEDEVVREANRAIRDGDTAKLSKYFEDALDTIHSRLSSSVWTESEQDKVDDLQFRRALVASVSSNLRSHGIRVTRIIETGERDGYYVTARDATGRVYSITFPFSLIEDGGSDEGRVRRLFDKVTAAILAERERYFRRMQ